MTKLGYYCDRILEWGWLAALVFTPLFFNVYSSRVFEPDKISLLRSIVLVMVVAWAIKILEGLGNSRTTNTTARGSGGGAATAAVSSGWPISRWWRIPLLLPILIYAALFLITSFTSVTPEVSIFGSYQRLQGLVSQYAYIMLALIIIFNVRTRAQVERIITFAIATAAPVALYGLLQHQNLDPLPWAGDVTTRVASSMGNAIFVAAWLIMIVPLLLYRIANLLDRLFSKNSDLEPETRDGDAMRVVGYAGVALAQNLVLWAALGLIAANQKPDFSLWFILPIAIGIFYGMTFIYGTARQSSRWFAWAQLIALSLLLLLTIVIIYFTQSRGPEIGLIAGVMVFLLAALWTRRMWKSLSLVGGLLALFIAFLVVFNLPNSPIADWRNLPYIGRLGTITQLDEGTGKVRTLIWQGAFNLIKSDPLRTVIGWGPESMYVAYNKFYPADLQHWELRNATPDRSHNAYIDQMVTMGISGELAWLLLIGSFLFFVWKALRRTKTFASQALILGLTGGVISHLVEISVGIQIAATYTYFYTYLGIFVALTFFIEKTLQPSEDSGDADARLLEETSFTDQPKAERGMLRVFDALKPRPALALAGAGNSAVGPITVAFASTSNRGGSGTQSGNPRKGSGNRNKANQPPTRPVIVPPARPVSGSATSPATNGNVASPTNGSVSTPTNGIANKISAVASGTPVVPAPKPQSQIQRASSRQRVASGRVDQAKMRPLTRWVSNTAFVWVYAVLAIAAILFIWLVNINLVYADMLYKQGQSADAQQVWPTSVQLYQQAINLQPDQDYYYLFMGRSYMEWSKNPGRFQQLTAAQATQVRDQLILQSEQTLLKALSLNPMNTDHYANLGRLYIYWGGVLGGDPATAQQALTTMQKGVDYYQQAVKLSPQNAQIWNELALSQRSLGLYMNQLNPPNQQGSAGASAAPTSTQSITSTRSVSASKGITNTTTPTTTAATTPTNTTAGVTTLKVPVRGDDVNPDALNMLLAAETSISHTISVVDNKFGNSYFIQGEIERSLDDAPKAAVAYDNLIDLVPVGNDTPSLASLADTEITQRAEFLVAGNVYTDVINHLVTATTKPATDAEAKANPSKGQYADSKDAYNFLGFLYWKSNQLPLAIAQIQKGEQLDGSDYFVHRNLSVLYGLNKQPQQQLNELVQSRDILNGSNWTSFFSTQTDHDNELNSVNATIQQVEQANPGLKAPAAPAAPPAPAAP